MEINRNLLSMPNEVLLHILRFIPNRFIVSQVSKKFYELVCKLEKNRFILKLGTTKNNWGEVRLENFF